MSDEDFDKVAQFNGEISALNKRIAEMQRGKGVMPNASPAQRFVTNVLMKALNRIKGIKVHRATQADVERVMAQVNGSIEFQGENKPSWKETITSLEAISHTLMSTDTRSNSNSESGAKVQQSSEITKSLAELSSVLDNGEAYSIKELVSKIALALGIQSANSKYSNYKTVTLKDGTQINIRVSTHQANAFNFEIKKNNKSINVGFVIKDGPSQFNAQDNVNYAEFVYYGDKTTDVARQKAIVDGIRQFIETGSFEGIAVSDRVNYSGKFKQQIDAQIIGEQGAANLDKAEEVTTRLDNLQVAREMETAGKDAKIIRMATGWERGGDGKWRYEIDDIKISERMLRYLGDAKAFYYELKDVLDEQSYSRLIAAYPQLEYCDVAIYDLPRGVGGYFLDNKGRGGLIVVSDRLYPEQKESTLAHELQHFIQNIEGFAKGGSEESVRTQEVEDLEERLNREEKRMRIAEETDDIFAAVKKKYDDFMDKGHYKNPREIYKDDYWNLLQEYKSHKDPNCYEARFLKLKLESMDEPTREATYEEYKPAIQQEIEFKKARLAFKERHNDQRGKIKQELDDVRFGLYQSIGGEVESRNVQRRLGMTEEQRRNTLLQETEDVAREDQIFLFDNAGVSEMGTRVDKRMGEIGEYFKDKDLTPEQRAIVDVFSGAKNSATVTFKNKDGKERTLHIRSGNENKGGVKHAIFRHYNSSESHFDAEDITKINTILEQGQRTETENGEFEYRYVDENGVEYIVATQMDKRQEVFITFYTNKEVSSTGLSNTQLSAQAQENTSNSTAKLQQKSETTKSEDKIELLQTPNGTVYGWSIGNEIWLTDEGMNPETPIHEYTHLFAKQMQQADAKAWKQVVSLCKKAKELWDAVKNDPNYSHLTTDDEIASEVLSRYSGKRGSQQAVGTAEQMVKDGKSFESDASAKVLIGRINKALEAFWGWVTDKLGIGHKYKSLDEIADKSLHDLLSGSEIEIADFTEEQEIIDKQEK